MSDPWIPSYFGSWEELIHALMHDPILGGGGGGPHHRPPSLLSEEMRTTGPSPLPWRLAVTYLVSTIGLKEAASQLQDEQLKKELIGRAELSIARFIDDYCGTGRVHPHLPSPWPGPPPWVQPTVSALVMVAHSYQEGSFRSEILHVAGTLIQTALTTRE